MNEAKFQELLTKTASEDPTTMLLYKFAAVSNALSNLAMNPKFQQAAGKYIFNSGASLGKTVNPNRAKILLKDLVMNPKFTQAAGKYTINSGASIGKTVGSGAAAKNSSIIQQLAKLLKNKFVLGAGLGGAGMMGYQDYKDHKAARTSQAAV